MLTATPQDNLSLLCFTRVLLCRHSTPPPQRHSARSCWGAKEIVAGVAPATLTFVVRTLAVLRTPNTAGTGRWQKDVACALPVGGHQCGKAEKNVVPRWDSNPRLQAIRAGMLTATPQDNLSLLCFTRVLLCRHRNIAVQNT
ncbi:hypothetical protein Zmor_017888 [Zophobas morio]|uniref:Uncharacterized protein n=1 Tax=Zophobas morio TaxID=2755281 RepID=A0AA38I5Z2_9CUCU|nr:hypothetical protein Zmor_017888 [Zophobas morio]